MALSSGEAELYEIIRAGSYTKYMVSLASDFGMVMDGAVLSDSTAAEDQDLVDARAMYRCSICVCRTALRRKSCRCVR